MKLAIISRRDSPNTLDLLRAAERQDIACSTYQLRDLALGVNSLFEHEFFSHDVYLFRGYNKNVTFAQSLAQFLFANGKTVVDARLAGGYLPSKLHEALVYKSQNIAHIPTYTAGNAQAWRASGISVRYPVVVKDIDSQKGKGVRLCQDEDSLCAQLDGRGFNIIVQDFLTIAFDIRVICVGDEVVGAIKRESAGDEFRTNVSLGGAASPYELNEAERELALSAHRSMGYDISGVDIAHDSSGNPFVIETNITPEWQGFKQATGIDVADKIIKYLIKKMS